MSKLSGLPSALSTRRMFDIDILKRVEGVTLPKQARSSAVFQAILHAMETLIAQKDYDEITVPEIAALAGCGIAAIYARFRDKASILAALHEALRMAELNPDQIFDTQAWQHHSPQENLFQFCNVLVTYYSSNRRLLRAILLLNDQGCYERASNAFAYISRVLHQLLSKQPNNPKPLDPRAVDNGVRAVFAVLQQRILFADVTLGAYPARDDAELCEQLSQLLNACIYGA